MKTALITTSINVPTVLALYRKLGPDVRFFVAIDEKTPEEAANFFAYDLPNVQIHYLKHEYKCSPLLGYSTDSRRNLALLDALEWGAEIILSIDDDMIPDMGDLFFESIKHRMTGLFSGVQFDAFGWFDAGQYTLPIARQRGLPYFPILHPEYSFANDVQIGAMQGIILGTPDTDASTTVVQHPFVHSATDVLKNGFVVGLDTHAVFNSQITSFRRELAPCFFQFYKTQGRNTDIIASVIMRRIMRDLNLYTYYGPPSGFHARTWRDPFKDMKAEQWGVENIEALAGYLDNTKVWETAQADISVTNRLRGMYDDIPIALMSVEHKECALAFLDDCEKVL